MVRPFAKAGYHCFCLDIQHPENIPHQPNIEFFKSGGSICRIKRDVTDPYAVTDLTKDRWDIVFAFPPCTHLAVSGARWFQSKGLDAVIEALQIVNACKKICEASGAPYMIENPVSTLSTYWRKPDHTFSPNQFAGYLEDPVERHEESYSKTTCLWVGGGFIMPPDKSMPATLGSKMHRLPPSADRGDLRSVTPKGFSLATYLANAPHLRQEKAA